MQFANQQAFKQGASFYHHLALILSDYLEKVICKKEL